MALFGAFRRIRRIRRNSAKPSVGGGGRKKPIWGGGRGGRNMGPPTGWGALGEVSWANLRYGCVCIKVQKP